MKSPSTNTQTLAEALGRGFVALGDRLEVRFGSEGLLVGDAKVEQINLTLSQALHRV